ncbi:DUF6022 family protein [Paenibacillus sp. UNC451MF]|uniref:DUF6022 family protein n=1 Tax=Paenibacillus sp. UNC451MF TaxID=1449063 RepID=UPI00048D2B4F|nr:DUF6022 family protein [Paenibacillus sp. UNC451MF]
MDKALIHTVVRNVEAVFSNSWRMVYQEKKEQLTQMFEQYGDRAYGVCIQEFMIPVVEQLRADGYSVKAGFNRKDSMENWGPPEERERCVWYVLHDDKGIPIGTMVLQIYHSHRTFHFPRAPRLFSVEVTDREQIISALSQATTRVRWDRVEERLPLSAEFQTAGDSWEYATDVALGDCLHGGETEHSGWTMDEALSHWGRYGWELVNVMPADGKVIAFFKRRRAV